MFLVYNSAVLPERDFYLLPTDRAFQYGDGLFETIRYEKGRICFWPDHYDRLTAGMNALQLTQPSALNADTFDSHTISQAMHQLIDANGLTDQPVRLKLQVWRRPGGLYTPTTSEADWLLTAQPGQPFAVTHKRTFGIYETTRLFPTPYSRFKTLNALPYVLAGLHKQIHALDEVILLDTAGHLGECLASNLFWYADETLYTPSLQTGCIAGIARRQLLRTFPDHREGFFTPDVLPLADVIFAANVMGIQILHGTPNETLTDGLHRTFGFSNPESM